MFLSVRELDARMAFGRFIRRRRERLGWSQRQLERVTNIDQTVISRIENGHLRSVRLHQVARFLCVLAPEILEIRVRQDGSVQEARTWEPVRSFEPPILAPPVSLDRARPSRQTRSPRGRRPQPDELIDAADEADAALDAMPVDAAEGIAGRDGTGDGTLAT